MKEMNGTYKTKNARPGATALVPGDGDGAAVRLLRAGRVHDARPLPRRPNRAGDHPPLLSRTTRWVHTAPLAGRGGRDK